MKFVKVKSPVMPLGAVLILAANAANAADMYQGGMKDLIMAEAPAMWSGFYVGVNGGLGSSVSESALSSTVTTTANVTPFPGYTDFSTQGAFGGGQIGYNGQRGNMVFGLEADFQGARIDGGASTLGTATYINGENTYIATMNASAKNRLDWFGSVRGRLGYASGGTLVYGTGGFAYGGTRNSLSWDFADSNGSVTATGGTAQNATLAGYTVGGGIETEIFSPALTVRAEYLYMNLGNTSLTSLESEGTPTWTAGAAATFHHEYHTVRMGLNYKINAPTEVLK